VPNEEYYIYLLKDADFLPVLKGDMNRLRGHFQEVQKRERDGCKVKFEIHSVSTIYFYLPLNEIDFFLGMCTLPFQTATSEERKM
jgi:hypothetical protein